MLLLAILHDLKIACRGLAKQPMFSLMSVGILAIGIAGTMMVFGLFNGLFLHPFPVPRQDRLMDLNEKAPTWDLERAGVAYPDFCTWREHNKSFESMFAWCVRGANLALDGRAERVRMLVTTHDYFSGLGIQPMLGRCFTQEEDRPGGPAVALLSSGLWERLSGKNPAILGQALQLDGTPVTVIGVLPSKAAFPLDADVWRPLAADPSQGWDSWYLGAMGRLKKGVTIEQARDDLTRIHKGLIARHPANEITSPTVMPLREAFLSDYRRGITILLVAVGFVLLIACCNVASIILARDPSGPGDRHAPGPRSDSRESPLAGLDGDHRAVARSRNPRCSVGSVGAGGADQAMRRTRGYPPMADVQTGYPLRGVLPCPDRDCDRSVRDGPGAAGGPHPGFPRGLAGFGNPQHGLAGQAQNTERHRRRSGCDGPGSADWHGVGSPDVSRGPARRSGVSHRGHSHVSDHAALRRLRGRRQTPGFLRTTSGAGSRLCRV